MTLDYDCNLSITGDGPPLVLVPGINGSGELFYRQVPLLARSHRVATYRLRDDAESFDELTADLDGIVTAVDAHRPAIVVGESFGGAIALNYALRYPARVSQLVILNSFPYFAPQFRLRLAIAALTLLPWRAMTAVRYLTAWRLHSPHTHRAEMRRFLELTRAATRQGYVNRLRLLRTYDVRAALPALAAPVLFLAATHDHLVPAPVQAELMATAAPRSTLRLLPGHGHICLIAPDLDLAAILKEWHDASAPT